MSQNQSPLLASKFPALLLVVTNLIGNSFITLSYLHINLFIVFRAFRIQQWISSSLILHNRRSVHRGHAGVVMSSEITHSECRPNWAAGKATRYAAIARVAC